MNEFLIVENKWHRTLIELPEEGREVLGVDIIDKDNENGDRFCLMADMYYLKKGTICKVEHDRKVTYEYPSQTTKTAEERLLKAIFGEDDDLQEIEQDGWYTFDTLNDEGLFRYRAIRNGYEPKYWCYPKMPDGLEMKRYADMYKID